MELFNNQGQRLRRTVGFDSSLVVDTDDFDTELTCDLVGSNLSYYSETLEQVVDKVPLEDDKQ